MSELAISTTQRDAAAVDAARSHHAELYGGLAARVAALIARARSGEPFDVVRDDLVGWCRGELLPHAYAEEGALYPAGLGVAGARMLVEAMIVEHQLLSDLIHRVESAVEPFGAASAAFALQTMFEAHVTKEDEQLIPALAASPAVSLADLLDRMHAATGHEDPAGGHRGCACGESDAVGSPELDARAVPHAIRHATVFGALDGVPPGEGLVLIAPHDPLPLLAQLERRSPGVFAVEYLQQGPEEWRLHLVRRTTPAGARVDES